LNLNLFFLLVREDIGRFLKNEIMKKNIRQNFFNHIKKVLDIVDKMGDEAKHFRCIVLMGDKTIPKAYAFMHASPEDLKNLILNAMRNSDQFTYATAKAFEEYDKELREKEETLNKDKNEENPIQDT
jgi:hypothetical protein